MKFQLDRQPASLLWIRNWFTIVVCGLLFFIHLSTHAAINITTPGTTDGQLNVGPDGSVGYSIPIRIPPGTAGVEPKVSLTYNSRGGPSPYGFGWTVGGLSSIERGPRNIAEDGIVSGVYLDDRDALYLDGEKLVQVSVGSDGSREYRSRIDNYSRIRAYEWTSAGPQRLIVDTRAGLKLYFGTTEATRVRIGTGGPVLIWLCDRIEDSVGNYMMFTYIVDGLDHRIQEINYTGNDHENLKPYAKISFEYSQVAPYDLKYVHGKRIVQRRQLQRIVTSFRGSVLREYKPSFEVMDKFRSAKRLVDLTESGADGLAYRPLRFLYSSAASGWRAERARLPDDVLNVSGRQNFVFANIQGESSQELLYRFTIAGQRKAGAFNFSNGSPSRLDDKWSPPIDLVGKNYRFDDLNGDGFDDLLLDGPVSYIAQKNVGWKPVSNVGREFKLIPEKQPDSRLLLTNIDFGDTDEPVLLWSSPKQSPTTGAVRLEQDKWTKLPLFAPPYPFQTDASGFLNGVYALDVDCDGHPELVYNYIKSDGTRLRAVFRSTQNGWEPIKEPEYLLPFDPLPHSAALKLADLNGDGCKDLVVAYRSGNRTVQKAWLATAHGWQSDSRPLPDVLFWDEKPGLDGRLIAELSVVSGDGNPEIFWHEQTDSGSSAGAYRLNTTEWYRDDSFAPPEPLPSSPSDRQLGFSIVGVHGIGKTQLAYFTEQGFPNLYSYTGGRWSLDGQLTPPQTIAQFDKADLGVRFPDLDGDGYADIAYTKKTGDGKLVKVAYVFKPGSKKPWEKDVRFKFPRPTFSEDLKDTGVFLVDFNGDGLIDLLYAYQSADKTKPPVLEAYVNCRFMPECKNVADGQEGGFWKSVTDPDFKGRYRGYVPPIAFAQEGVGSLGVRAVDINGDGLTDLVVSREEDNPNGTQATRLVQRVFLNKIETNVSGQKAGKWVELRGTDVLPPIAFTRPYRAEIGESINGLTKVRDNRVELIDLDGDRLPDIVYHYVTAIPKPKEDVERNQRVADGKLPVEFERIEISGAYLNRGGKWVAAPAYKPPHRLDSDDTENFENAKSVTQTSFQDLNGDGLPDLIYSERCEGPCAPGRDKAINETYINTGAEWQPETAYNIPVEALLKNTKGDQGYRLLDVNADGLVDVVYHRILEGGAHEKGAFLNTGIGWVKTNESDGKANRDGYAPPIAFVDVGRGDLGVRPLDLNGDGIVDLVQTYKRSNSETTASIWINAPFASPEERPYKTDLLAEVVDGLGRRSRLNYQSYIGTVFNQEINLLSAYLGSKKEQQEARRPEYPILDPPMPGYVAIGLEVTGPGLPVRTSGYRYRGYRLDTLTGTSLGFEEQEITDKERGRKTNIRFLQQDGLVGSIATTSVKQKLQSGTEIEISRSTSSFSVVRRPGAPLNDGFVPEVLRSKLDQIKSVSRDLSAATLSGQTDEFKYDDNGNTISVKTTFEDGSGSETTNYYEDNLIDWHLARLTESYVTQFSNGNESQTRHAEFAYSSTTGQLIKEVSLAGTPYEATIEYERDGFGNKISSRTSVKTGELPRVLHVEYDALGRFPVVITDHLGHKSRVEFDDVSGVISAKIDPNRIRQAVRYDSLQHVRQEIDSTGVVTSTTTDFASDKLHAFKVVKQVGNLPPTTTVHDAAGRLVIDLSTGFEGKPVVVEYAYDALGRLSRSSIPRFIGEQPKYITRRYDELDRQVEERHPDGAVLETSYEGLKTVATDSLQRESVIEKDLRGRTKLTVDPLKGRTQFEFDASGNTTRIINALGQISHVEYNIAGQRIALDDPTLGRWTYKFNGFGELIKQTDARGEVVTLRYDELGRLVERKSRTDVASYQFDRGSYAIGRLTNVKSSQGEERSIGYDQYGRVQSVEFHIGTDISLIEQSYDGFSRPLERKYSSGFTVSNTYDNWGFWRQVSVSGTATSKIAWESLDVDALGRVTVERLGNGVVTSQKYDGDNGHLIASTSKSAGGNTIQDFTLAYDLVGNVIQRVDHFEKRAERYEYDELNRITGAAELMGERINVKYDPLGNVLVKTDIGTYQYCDSERTRVLCGIKSQAGVSSSLSYDAAGNMLRLGEKKFTYDGEGRVAAIAEGLGNQSNFQYGADGELIRQQSRAGLTQFEVTYLGDTEILREEYAPPFNPTPERTRVRHFISSPTGSLGFFETTYWHFPFRHASPIYGMLLMDNPIRSSEVSYSMTYFIKDQLGSLRATLNDQGDVTERFEYDPWGKRRQSGDKKRYYSVRQGFTGQEHLDNLDLIHMGGRIYSPALARFVSPDPFVQYAGYSQSHNRYSYVLNNPLRYIDPSGYWSLGGAISDFFGAVGKAAGNVLDVVVGKPLSWIGEQLSKAGHWLGQNWRTVAIIAATVALGPAGGYLSAFLIGAAIGGASAALYGGSMEDILRGAILGGITGVLFYGVGSAGLENQYLAAGAHGVVGGVSNVIQGGDFGSGFFAAAFTKISAGYIPEYNSTGYQIATAAAVGGVASEISGGSFENGAITGAFSRMFNDLSCHASTQTCSGVRPTKDEIDAHYREGTGWPVFAESMDPSWLTSEQFDQIPIGKEGLITTNWNSEIFRSGVGDRDIYGSFTATRVDADHFLWRDNYGFEMHGGGEWVRNAATLYGRVRALNGDLTKWNSAKSFPITGTRPVKIPGR